MLFGKKSNHVFWSIVIVIVLLVGAYLRLDRIDQYMVFLGDEGRDALIVKRMITDGKWTLLGPTASVGGFFLGPIYYYFMLPALWVAGLNPVGPAVMVALFGVATIYLIYRFGKEVFSPFVGIVAASLYALSPVAIIYSRSSWNPNVVPFFAMLLIIFLHRTVAKAKVHELFWVGFILGIGIQLHYLFMFLFVLVGLWYAIFGRKKAWLPYYGLGLLGVVAGASPFLIFELRHNFSNIRSIINFLSTGNETGFTFDSFMHTMRDVPFRLFGRLVLRIPEEGAFMDYTKTQVAVWVAATRVLIFSSITVLIVGLVKKRHIGLALLGLWGVTIILLFGFYQKNIYDYYFGIMFPLPFFLVALVLEKLANKKLLYLGIASWIIIAGLLWLGRPTLKPPNNLYTQVRTIAQVAFDKAEGKPFNFALMSSGNSDHAYRFFFEVWGNTPVTIENDVIDPDRSTVTDQLIVICELDTCDPIGNPLWEIAGFGQAEVVSVEEVPFVKVMKLVHYEE